jgi:hypothetical protein
MRKFIKELYEAWVAARQAIINERLKTGHWE